MSYTTIASKTDGVSAIAESECTDLESNISWFRTRPTFRVYADFNAAQTISSGSWNGIHFDPVASNSLEEWHEEWLSPEPSTTYFPNAGGDGSELNQTRIQVGDVEAGIWIVGGAFQIEANGTGKREGRLQESGSGQIAARHQLASSTRPAGFHVCAPWEFAAADYYELQGWQDSGGIRNILENRLPPRFWGLWVSSSDRVASNYASTRATSGTSVSTAWNNIRSKMLRLQSPPAARVRRSTTQAITTAGWTTVLCDATVYETDSDLVDASESEIDIQQTGFYLCTFGAEFDAYTTSAKRAYARLTVDGVDQGVDTWATAYDTTTGDTQVYGAQVLKLEAGEALAYQVFHDYGSNRDLSGTHLNHLSATMLAGDPDDLAAARQDFTHTGLPSAAELHVHTDHSASRLELGYLNLISDVCDFLWSPPVYKRRVRRQEGATVGYGKWEAVPLTTTVLDPHGYDADDSSINMVGSNGGIVVPFAGTYVAVGHATINSQDEDDDGRGDSGHRGIRTAVNGQHVTRYLDVAGTASPHEWAGSVVDLHICKAGDEICVELYQNNSAETELDLDSASLTVVWVGDGLTRDAE